MENLVIEFIKFHFVFLFLTAGIYLFIKLLKAGAN
jgi:hypothetical protein